MKRALRPTAALMVATLAILLSAVGAYGVLRFIDYGQHYAQAAIDASQVGEQVQVMGGVAARATAPDADRGALRIVGVKAGLGASAAIARLRAQGLELDEVVPLQERLNAYFARLGEADRLFASGDEVGGRQVAVQTAALLPPITRLTERLTSDLNRSASAATRMARAGSVSLLLLTVVAVGTLLGLVQRRRRRAAVEQATDVARQDNVEALADLNQVLRAVTAADAALVHATDEESLLEDMCRVIVESGGYPRAWIAGPDATKPGQVWPVASYGDGGSFHRAVMGAGEPVQGPVGDAVSCGRTMVVNDITGLPTELVVRRIALEHGYRSVIAAPVFVDAVVYGALVVYSNQVNGFDSDAVSLLEDLARNLGYGIGALRSRVERQAYLRRLERRFGGMIDVVATTVELRDPYTAGHQRGVARLAAAIGREMGLDADTVEGIEVAAGLHDIGKVAIPAEILSKPTRLTPPEFELIKQHSRSGYDIVRTIEFPWPVAEMILQHHERLDGSGYPAGLVGEEIQLGARVIAVADTVEAMAAHRPYRASKGIESALAQIEHDRVTRLDPDVVDACLRLFRTRRFHLDEPAPGCEPQLVAV